MKKYLFTLVAVFLTGAAINFFWESLHIHLYQDFEAFAAHLPLPVLIYTPIIDGLLIVIIFLSVSLMYKNFWWIKKPLWHQLGLALVVGIILSVGIEKNALAQGKWGYNNFMPIIPFLRVGLSPVLQMVITPLLTFWCVKNYPKVKV